MKELLRIVKELQSTNGKIEKQEIISKNLDNKDFVDMMRFLLNDFILTGISNKKMSKKVKTFHRDEIMNIFGAFDYLKENNTGKDYDIAILNSFINNKIENKEEKDLARDLITKELKLGVSADTWNKLVPINMEIPVFDVLLAKKFEDHKHKIKGNFVISKKLDGCFEGNTLISMGNGDKTKIKNIKVGDIVASFNEKTLEIESKRVEKIFKNGFKNKEEWVKISTDGNVKNSNKIIVTKNHKIFTPNGWRKVSELKIGDSIYEKSYKPSREQIQFIIGSGIGDSTITKDSDNSDFGRLSTTRSLKEAHKDMLNLQSKLFSDFKITYSEKKSGYGASVGRNIVTSMKFLKNDFIDSVNLRSVNGGTTYKINKWSMNLMDEMGLALFYIDDGTKRLCQMDGDSVSNISPRASISVYRQSLEEVELFKETLKNKFNINIVINKDKNNSVRIDINKEDSHKFYSIISKYIPEKMRYKIPKSYRDVEIYKWWDKKGEESLSVTKIKKIDKDFNSNSKKIQSYDLQIEDNHTYFANNIAVHNCRVVVIKQNGKVKSYTRKGKEYVGLNQIEDEIRDLAIDNIVFDGELLADVKGNTNEVFAETLKKSRGKAENKTGLIFHVFDMLSLIEFQVGKSRDNAVLRKTKLNKLFCDNKFNHIQEVESLYIGDDLEEISKWTKWAEDNEFEGVMVNMDLPYVCKRSDSLLKVKGMQTCDIKVIGFEEGEGRNQGRLGAIICEYKNNTVNVGSGYSDYQREEIWNNQDKWLGRVIEVSYFEESKNSKTGLTSLRFPVFKILREEGKEVSYN